MSRSLCMSAYNLTDTTRCLLGPLTRRKRTGWPFEAASHHVTITRASNRWCDGLMV